MPDNSSSLDALRRDIDEIDDRLAALLADRAGAVARVAEIKAKDGAASTPMRPAREAAIVRRRIEAGAGALPPFVLARLWRELIAAFCRIQGPLSVAVCAPEKPVGYWDLARDHFGSATPMTLHQSPNLVLRAVADGSMTVGILPMPVDEDLDPWWGKLSRTDPSPVRVIARLPFCDNAVGRTEDLEAMVVARLDIEETGDDRSLFVLSTSADVSRASLNSAIAAAGFEGRSMAALASAEPDEPRRHLFEVAGFFAGSDSRIVEFAGQIGGADASVQRVGGYATPMTPAPAE